MEKPSNSADQLAHSSKVERVVKWLDITTSAGNYFLQQDFLVPILVCRKWPS